MSVIVLSFARFSLISMYFLSYVDTLAQLVYYINVVFIVEKP